MLVDIVLLPRYIIHDERIEYYKNGVSNGISIYQIADEWSHIIFEYRRNKKIELILVFKRRSGRQLARTIGVTEYKNGKQHGIEYDISELTLDDDNDTWTYRHHINGKTPNALDMDLVHDYHWAVLAYLQRYSSIVQARHVPLFARRLGPVNIPPYLQFSQMPDFPALLRLVDAPGLPFALPNRL